MIYHYYLKEWKLNKAEKLVTSLPNKTEYVIHVKNLKQALNHGWIWQKFIEWLTLIKSLAKARYWYEY